MNKNLLLRMLNDFPVQNEKETRAGFGEGIYEAAKKNNKIVALTADLAGSLKLNAFIKDFPDRFYQCGIAEANMIGVAAGMTIGGMIPYTTTFANFSTSRVYDQIRQSVAYSGKNVKICASHAGLTLGEDGATHQVLEDIGMMKMLPGMTVIVPCDFNQTKAATMAIADYDGPVYLRFGRPKWPNFTPVDVPFEIGKAQQIHEGNDVSIFACGHMVWEAMKATEQLAAENIHCDLINIHTIKPLDQDSIIRSATKTGCVVTAEEHQANGGLGDSVAQVLSQHCPCPHEYIAVQDSFGESGKPTDLLVKYGLTSDAIVAAVKKSIARK
ncbi:MAG TPA: transketolase C-terminal domain-containing protein [Chitinophagaceae bacterium]|nr:transketolase C-terminal domain-containing protein [Chitinophagaceae bacterium]